MGTYQILSRAVISSFGQNACIQILRDVPEGARQPIQIQYLNEVMGYLLRTLVKVYSKEPLANVDRDNLKRYLSKVIEAKEAIDGRDEQGRPF